MRCFPACFGRWRNKETMENVQDQLLSKRHELDESVKLLPASTTESLKEEEIVNPMKLVSESEGKFEEQMNESNRKKAVVCNSNVHASTNERASHKLLESDNGAVEKEMDTGKDDGKGTKSSSRIPYSADQEHQDFLINDKDSSLAVKSKEITLECCPVQEESSESLFSLSIDSRNHVFTQEMGEKEVTSPLKKPLLKYDEEKENVPLNKNPIIKQPFNQSKPKDDHHFKRMDIEMAVDTSLSSWLVEPEKSPQKTSTCNSPDSEKNYGERQILGATISPAEHKDLNEFSSAGSTPCCCSADDRLGIGMVGRWRQGGGLANQIVDGSGLDLAPSLLAEECQLSGPKCEH